MQPAVQLGAVSERSMPPTRDRPLFRWMPLQPESGPQPGMFLPQPPSATIRVRLTSCTIGQYVQA